MIPPYREPQVDGTEVSAAISTHESARRLAIPIGHLFYRLSSGWNPQAFGDFPFAL